MEPCTRYGIASPHMHWKPEQMYSTLSSLWGIPVFHPLTDISMLPRPAFTRPRALRTTSICKRGASMPEVQNVFSEYGEVYESSHPMTIQQRKAFHAIRQCRTAALGGHVDECPDCGYQRPSYNSCRNRHCPKCQSLLKERWIEKSEHTGNGPGPFDSKKSCREDGRTDPC